MHPTRGLDVGAIEYIHKNIMEQRDNGIGVLLVSTELEEILKLSDRIAVMYEGKIMGIVKPCETTVEEMGLMMGGTPLQKIRG
jgi:simple sugar transport system ATP-binding protein